MSNDPKDKGFEQSIGKQSADRGEKETARFEGEDQHGFSPDVGKGKVAKEGGDKAFEANETQDASKSEGGAIYAPEKGAEHVGESISSRGEEQGLKKDEPGLVEDEGEDGAGRPRAKTTPRFSTGVNPVDTVDEGEEHLPPGGG